MGVGLKRRIFDRILSVLVSALLLVGASLVATPAEAQTPIPNIGSFNNGKTLYNRATTGCINCHGSTYPDGPAYGPYGSNITAANNTAAIVQQINDYYSDDGGCGTGADMAMFHAGCSAALSTQNLLDAATYVAGFTPPTTINGSVNYTYNTAATVSTTGLIDTDLSVSPGTATGIVISSQPAHGSAAVVTGTFSITYTPAAGYTGSDSFTYHAVNNAGGDHEPYASNVSTISVGFTVQPPSAGSPTYSTAYATADSINLSTQISGVYTTVNIIQTPTKGTLTVSGAKSDQLVYTPGAGTFNTTDTIKYTAVGAPSSNTSTGTITINIGAPTAPVAAAYAVNATNTGATTIDLTSSITPGAISASANIITQPIYGTLTRTGNFTFTYTPEANSLGGTDTFTFQGVGVTTLTSNTATGTITVAGPAAKPVATSSTDSVAFDSTNNAVPLSVTGAYTSVTIGTPPAHGSVTTTAATMSGSTITAYPTIVYTPTAGSFGSNVDSFTYTANNSDGSSAPATVTITVPQPATPVANTVSPAPTASYNTPVTFNVQADITGYSSGITVTQPTNGAATVSGYNITYTPNSAFQGGSDPFTYTAIGYGSNSAAGSVPMSVAPPGAPTLSTPPSVPVAYNGAAVTVSLAAYVTSASSYTLAISSNPSLGTATVSGTNIIYTPTTLSYGADSLQFTAKNGGGTSAAATLSFVIANPPPPSAAPLTLSDNYASPATIDLTTGASGRYNSVALNAAAPPAHGTVTRSGNVVTYTPNPLTYFGADSFGYSVVGPTSTTNGTVTVTVATPGSPNAGAASLTVAYQTAGAINLGSTVTGVYNSVAIVAQPTHGTLVLSGTTATYTPAALYYGSDTFTYNATGPGGTGGTGTVSITVGLPPAPTVTNGTANVTFNTAQTIALAPTASGVYTTFAITTQPSHGTASISGQNLIYTPTTGYYGPDTVAYTATGPGGTSSPATLSLTIVRPAPPLAAMTSANVPFNQPVTIDLTKAIAGYVTSIAISDQPEYGSAVVSGLKVTYTPNHGYYGSDSFAYQATGPGGTSQPASVTLNVLTAAAAASNVSMTVALNNAGSVDLAGYITGSGISGVTIVTPPAHGKATVAGTVLTYRPANNFFGQDTLTYKAFGAAGVSNISMVTITITGRPNPVQDPDVQGIVASEMSSAERFGQAQISNFQSHLSTLHEQVVDEDDQAVGGAGSPLPKSTAPGAAGSASPGYSANPGAAALLSGSNGGSASGTAPAPAQVGAFQSPQASQSGQSAQAAQASLPSMMRTGNGAASSGNGWSAASLFGGASMQRTSYFPGSAPAPVADGGPLSQSITSVDLASLAGGMMDSQQAASVDHTGLSSMWILGSVNFGERTPNGTTQNFDTDGVSFGIDDRLSRQLVVGVGAGYGRDKTSIGTDGSRTRASGVDVAVYASYAPLTHTFIDAVVGVGSLNFDATRTVAPIDASATSHRSGEQIFGSVAAGYEWHKAGASVTPYTRLDVTQTTLNQVSEGGAAQYDLNYQKQNQTSVQGAIGLKLATAESLDNGGVARPHITLEYQHEFENAQNASLSYADLIGTTYTLAPNVLDHNTITLGIGADFLFAHGLSLGWDYDVVHAGGIENSQMIRVKLSQDLDKNFVLPLVEIHPLANIRADLGYSADDNITRSTDKLSDQSWSLGISRVFINNFNENSRLSLEPSAGFEKFETYTGLSHADVGLKAELQYRQSGDFSSPTYAVFAKIGASNFESMLRDGERYQLGASIFMPLTDRINGFAALGVDDRQARSSVFDNADGFLRASVDYALTPSSTVYLSGEYRYGDMVSSGFPSLANLDSAKIYVLDDAFPGSGRIAYRFKGTAGIATLGYNLGISSTSSVDLSYRIVTSSPNHQPDYDIAPTIRYVDHQLSLVYLVRF